MALNLLFLDLETTGLDPEKCQIIECAAVIVRPGHVNPEAEVVDALIIHEEVNLHWEPYAHEMHVKSGLLDAWRTLGRVSCGGVENALLEAVGTCPPFSVLLAGNSIHFDRSFIKVHMPRLHAALHHRHMDVSCIMNFFEDAAQILRTPATAHRAMADVEASMAAYDRLHAWTRSRATPDAPNGGA